MSKRKPGKRKQRSELKRLLLLEILRLEGHVGRYRLKDLLGLPEHEGVVKLMLNELCEEGYVEASKAGCGLTDKGEKHLNSLLKRYSIIRVESVRLDALGPKSGSLAVHVGGQFPQRVLELRDSAVRAGTDGMILIYNEGGHLRIPSVYEDLDLECPAVSKELRSVFDMSVGGMFMIGLSNDKWRALEGALAATMARMNVP